MSGSWAFCAKLWLTDKLGGRWSGHGLVWGLLRGKWSGLRSASWKMVWTGGLLREKRSGLEVCWEENGLVWRYAVRKMAWFGYLPRGKWSVQPVCWIKVVWFVGGLKIVRKGDKNINKWTRKHYPKQRNLTEEMLEKIKTTHWHCNTLFHFFPMFCPIFFFKNSHFFVRLFCPFYLNVQFFLRFFLSDYFVRSIWMSDILSDLFECAIFFVRFF